MQRYCLSISLHRFKFTVLSVFKNHIISNVKTFELSNVSFVSMKHLRFMICLNVHHRTSNKFEIYLNNNVDKYIRRHAKKEFEFVDVAIGLSIKNYLYLRNAGKFD